MVQILSQNPRDHNFPVELEDVSEQVLRSFVMNMKSLAKRGLIKSAELRHKHHNWIVTWIATQVCNLRCVYCTSEYRQKTS